MGVVHGPTTMSPSPAGSQAYPPYPLSPPMRASLVKVCRAAVACSSSAGVAPLMVRASSWVAPAAVRGLATLGGALDEAVAARERKEVLYAVGQDLAWDAKEFQVRALRAPARVAFCAPFFPCLSLKDAPCASAPGVALAGSAPL